MTQPIPIPSYLLAIAAGNVVYRAFEVPEGKTWTSGLWAEPELIDAAWHEFHADAPRWVRARVASCHHLLTTCSRTRFLAAEEEVTIPYQFGVYDLLVLPPAFPYGGMVCMRLRSRGHGSLMRQE